MNLRRRSSRVETAAIALLVALAVGGCGGCGGDRSSPAPDAAAVEINAAEFVGRKRCTGCHPAESAAWQGSDHDRAMAPANDESVLGDFDDAEFRYAGVTSRFYRDGERFMVRTDGVDGELHDFEIAYTFGFEPLQQYLIEFPGGRLQALNVCWDTRPAEVGGRRWFHLYPDERVDHEDILHWTGPLQNWNYMCSECHSTNVRKGYDAASDRYATSWSEIDVSCESCHGPASTHVAWAEAERRDAPPPNLGFPLQLANPDGGGWLMAPDAVTARRSRPRQSHVELESCARCHSRRSQLTDELRHGEPLAHTHRVSLLEPTLYHADGQVLDEVYVYGSFLQSKMYREGVTCSDCHDPHSTRLRLEGNATCSPCHKPAHFDAPSHHFHAEGSSGASCVACHMPPKNFMVVDARNDHSFRVPRPDLSLEIGTPNACTACHAERDAAWAAATVEEWFGSARAEQPHYGEALHAARTWSPEAIPALIDVVENDESPAIVRATALSLLGERPSPRLPGIVERAARERDPLVRAAAADAMATLEPSAMLSVGLPLLDDPALAVRIAAAFSLASVPQAALTAESATAIRAGLDEYASVQRFNADRAEGRLNLAWLDLRDGRTDEAEAGYRAALRMMPGFPPAAINLADFLRTLGRDAEGEQVVRDALLRTPDSGDLHHVLGLILVREKRYDEAVIELRRAHDLAPEQPHYAYVLAVALHSRGQTPEALRMLQAAHERHPGHPGLLLLLAAIHRDGGDAERAASYARRLLEFEPSHAEARALLSELEARR